MGKLLLLLYYMDTLPFAVGSGNCGFTAGAGAERKRCLSVVPSTASLSHPQGSGTHKRGRKKGRGTGRRKETAIFDA